MDKIFRQVSVKERLPELNKDVVVIWTTEPLLTRMARFENSGYWFLSDGTSDCDQPDYWFEEIEIPTYEDTRKERDAYSYSYLDPFRWGWKYGVKHILNIIKEEKN